MTTIELIIAMLGAGGAGGALITQIFNRRKNEAEAGKTEAERDKVEHESDSLIISNLRAEVDRLGTKVIELEKRVVESERRATSAETRLADAEYKASESRRVIITLGEKLDEERKKNVVMIEKLLILIDHLVLCVECPDKAGEIDMDGIKSMIANIRNGMPG